LARSAGDVGNVLVRERVLEQHFKTYLPALIGHGFFDELNNAGARIFEQERL